SKVIDKFKTRLGYNAASSTAASSAVERFMNSSEMNFMPHKPDLTFMDEIVESENLDVTTIVTPIELKTVRMNSFRPPVIEDWNSDDESEVEIIPKDKTLSSSTEKIKLVNSAR
ncbi:hypothetical protein Tco_1581539, partial [Tanacetum coccineum]